MVEMCRKQVIPAVIGYVGHLADSLSKQESRGLAVQTQQQLLNTVQTALNQAIEATEQLHVCIAKALSYKDEILKQAQIYRDEVVQQMQILRSHIDLMETYTDKACWPFPSYDDLLYRL